MNGLIINIMSKEQGTLTVKYPSPLPAEKPRPRRLDFRQGCDRTHVVTSNEPVSVTFKTIAYVSLIVTSTYISN